MISFKLDLHGKRVNTSISLTSFSGLNWFIAKKMSELEQRAKDAEETLPQRVEKAIYDYQRSEDVRLEAGKEAAYCLFFFTKTYKEDNPAIVANYEEFIEGYDPEWSLPWISPLPSVLKNKKKKMLLMHLLMPLLYSYLYF
ncbi:hypothetical protein LIER_32944 [Lithospermum erythrorhizon]|uniref:Uncharacterized protein n=1 Tax=Lithospermum erythrorhizon TaxID=34254 RepID=A0AAV3S0J4_LITER